MSDTVDDVDVLDEGDTVSIAYTLERGPREGHDHFITGAEVVSTAVDGQVTLEWGIFGDNRIVVNQRGFVEDTDGDLGSDALIKRVEEAA